MSRLTRRQLLGTGAGLALAGLAGISCRAPGGATRVRPTPAPPGAGQPYLAIGHGSDPAALTRAAVSALGGIARFVRPGQDVIVKPNICVEYHPPEYAATTNPTVVATIVRLCLEAGAKRVRVMDMPLGGTPEAAYEVSGIGPAVREAGGEMEVMSSTRYVRAAIPDGSRHGVGHAATGWGAL
jgi:hypothetical protein